MGGRQETRHAAELFGLLGDANRIAILLELSDEERCVHEISDAVGAELSNVSHHLRKMREVGIVTARKDGRHRYYRLKDDHILTIIETGVMCAHE